jgi:putative holliday junction resolvase
MGIDYGNVRLGIAISDPLFMNAYPLTTLSQDAKLMNNLKELLAKNAVTKIILGFPKNMNGSIGPAAQKVLEFKNTLEMNFQLPVELVDERLSTVQAGRLLHENNQNTRKQKNKIDMAAAAVILQNYLDKKPA